MVTGQIADIRNPVNSSPENTLKFIHANKTGALITAAIQIGALLAQVGIENYRALTCFGEEIGKCFQVKDDILDETGKKEILGKNPGSDQKNKTLNYPDVFGLSKSHQLANEFYEKATGFLDQSGLDTTRLRQLADFVLKREH